MDYSAQVEPEVTAGLLDEGGESVASNCLIS